MFEEPRADDAERLLSGWNLCAPTLLHYELASIARTKITRHPELHDVILVALTRGLALDITLVPVPHALVCELALEAGLSTYDASYLYLSRRLGAPLFTFDQKLAAATG